MHIKIIFEWASAMFSIIAAGLWFYASVVRIAAPEEKLGQILDGIVLVSDDGKRTDMIATTARQTLWNRRAALSAAVAAACQAIFLMLQN